LNVQSAGINSRSRYLDILEEAWQRQRGEDGELEPNLWFSRFTDYRLAGPSRSLLGCVNRERVTKGHKESNFTPGSWREAFERWNWKARVEAWDEHIRQELEAEWEARRKEVKEQEWASAGKLLERVGKMLKFPLSEVIQEDKDGKVFKVQPVRWSQSDITRFLEAASKLRRLAAEMETDRAGLDLTSKGEKIESLNTITVREYIRDDKSD